METLSLILLKKPVMGPILVIVGSLILYYILKEIIVKLFKIQKKSLLLKKTDKRRQVTLCNLALNVVKYFIVIIDIIIILGFFGIDTAAIITSLGVIGVVVGLALQDLLKDFISGFVIMIENQFTVGDYVTIDGFEGEVISLGLKTTKIKAITGEVNIISNHNITKIINHSLADSLAQVDVGVSYDEDLDKVEKILNKLFKRLNGEIKDLKGEIYIAGVNDLSSSAVEIRIRALTKPMCQYDVQRVLLKEIKKEFDKNKIEIPYDQVVIHNG